MGMNRRLNVTTLGNHYSQCSHFHGPSNFQQSLCVCHACALSLKLRPGTQDCLKKRLAVSPYGYTHASSSSFDEVIGVPCCCFVRRIVRLAGVYVILRIWSSKERSFRKPSVLGTLMVRPLS